MGPPVDVVSSLPEDVDPDVVEDNDRGLGRLLQDVRHANDVPRRVEVLGLLFLQTTWSRIKKSN